MRIYNDISLSDFEFWSGAADRAANLTDDDFDTIESCLEDAYPDGLSATDVNDIFWFDFDIIVQWLGYDDEEDFDRRRNQEDEEEEDEEYEEDDEEEEDEE